MTGIAVVGCGYWGNNLIRNFNDLGHLKCVCDTNKNNLDKILEKFNTEIRTFNEILDSDDISGIVISTPAETHYKLAYEALGHNKHVFVEKPLALHYEEANKLVDLAQSNDLVLMVGHLLQYHPAFVTLRNFIQDGGLGNLRYIYSNRLNFGKLRKEENILWSFAPHDISMILSITNSEPLEIQAKGATYLNENIPDVTTTYMKFADNINAHVFVSWLHPHKEQKLVIIGSEGMAVFDDQKKHEEKILIYPHKVNWKDNMPLAEKAEAESLGYEDTEPLRNECLHFIDCIQNNIKCITDGEEGIRVLKVLNQAQQSLDN